MHFRQAVINDLNTICSIISDAVDYMLAQGRQQWSHSYPARSHISEDIACGRGYVLEDDCGILAYGAVVFTGEPAYGQLDGKWMSDAPYVVVHRLAVAQRARGRGLSVTFMRETETLARRNGITNFRIDTNYDNVQMLHLMDKLGFTYRGEIRYDTGLRRAYEKQL